MHAIIIIASFDTLSPSVMTHILGSRYPTAWAMVIGPTLQMASQMGADQIAVQRFLTATDTKQMIRSVYYASLLQLIVPVGYPLGYALFGYYAHHHQVANVTAAINGDFDRIFPHFVLYELPAGCAGLLVAATLGSSMSVSSSILLK